MDQPVAPRDEPPADGTAVEKVVIAVRAKRVGSDGEYSADEQLRPTADRLKRIRVASVAPRRPSDAVGSATDGAVARDTAAHVHRMKAESPPNICADTGTVHVQTHVDTEKTSQAARLDLSLNITSASPPPAVEGPHNQNGRSARETGDTALPMAVSAQPKQALNLPTTAAGIGSSDGPRIPYVDTVRGRQFSPYQLATAQQGSFGHIVPPPAAAAQSQPAFGEWGAEYAAYPQVGYPASFSGRSFVSTGMSVSSPMYHVNTGPPPPWSPTSERAMLGQAYHEGPYHFPPGGGPASLEATSGHIGRPYANILPMQAQYVPGGAAVAAAGHWFPHRDVPSGHRGTLQGTDGYGPPMGDGGTALYHPYSRVHAGNVDGANIGRAAFYGSSLYRSAPADIGGPVRRGFASLNERTSTTRDAESIANNSAIKAVRRSPKSLSAPADLNASGVASGRQAANALSGTAIQKAASEEAPRRSPTVVDGRHLNTPPPQGVHHMHAGRIGLQSTTTAASGPHAEGVTANLVSSQLWWSFHEHNNEMIVTRNGRCLFPVLAIRIANLVPRELYSVALDFAPADSHRWKYIGGAWVVGGRPDSTNTPTMYVHPDSPNYGSFWMEGPVTFSKAKLTNRRMDTSGCVVLNSLHRYLPRFHIFRVDPRGMQTGEPVFTISFPETLFFAVTAYQNERIKELKIKNNPFAKAFVHSAPKVDADADADADGSADAPP